MSRYVTLHHEGRVSRPDPRPLRPMRRGGFSPLDLPIWAIAIVGADWIPRHVHPLGLAIAAMAAIGITGGIIVSMIRIRVHAHRSKPMLTPDDDDDQLFH